jgi:hypothetical protein
VRVVETIFLFEATVSFPTATAGHRFLKLQTPDGLKIKKKKSAS